jgi:hypothetical protein
MIIVKLGIFNMGKQTYNVFENSEGGNFMLYLENSRGGIE